MASSNTSPFSQVGLDNPDPVETIIHKPLNYKTLQDMDPKVRNREVASRANFFAQFNLEPFALDRAVGPLLVKARNAASDAGTAIRNPPTKALKLPIDLLSSQHEMSTDLKEKKDAIIRHMHKRYEHNEVSSAFNNRIALFKETELHGRLRNLVIELCKSGKFDKIVAFGAGTFDYQGGRDKPQGVKQLTQHAALLSIRDIWEEFNSNRNGEFQIYLQDPFYSAEDEKVAKNHGMTVVKGAFSHQMGWIKIDESTLVVDFATPNELFLARLVFEISRPAGVLICFPWPRCTPMIGKEAPHTKFVNSDIYEEVTLLTKMPNAKEQIYAYPASSELKIGNANLPHYGIQLPILPKYWEEYDVRALDTTGLRMGKKEDKSTNADCDGCGGECYLGGRPILLERKT